jgi:hypothetical protein
MNDLFRDTAAGHFIRYVTKYKAVHYPEERFDFELPQSMVGKREISGISAGSSPAKLNGEGSESVINSASTSVANGLDIERSDLDRGLHQIVSQVVQSAPTRGDIILVDWYSEGELQADV